MSVPTPLQLWQYYSGVRAYNDTTSDTGQGQEDKKAAEARNKSWTEYMTRLGAVSGNAKVAQVFGGSVRDKYQNPVDVFQRVQVVKPPAITAFTTGDLVVYQANFFLGKWQQLDYSPLVAAASQAGFAPELQRPLAVAWWLTSPQVADVQDIARIWNQLADDQGKPGLKTKTFNPPPVSALPTVSTAKKTPDIFSLNTNPDLLMKAVMDMDSDGDDNVAWPQFFVITLGLHAKVIDYLLQGAQFTIDNLKTEAQLMNAFAADPNFFQFVQSRYCAPVFQQSPQLQPFLTNITSQILTRRFRAS